MKKVLFLLCLGAGIATTVFAAKDNSIIGSYSVSNRSGEKVLGTSMYSDGDTELMIATSANDSGPTATGSGELKVTTTTE